MASLAYTERPAEQRGARRGQTSQNDGSRARVAQPRRAPNARRERRRRMMRLGKHRSALLARVRGRLRRQRRRATGATLAWRPPVSAVVHAAQESPHLGKVGIPVRPRPDTSVTSRYVRRDVQVVRPRPPCRSALYHASGSSEPSTRVVAVSAPRDRCAGQSPEQIAEWEAKEAYVPRGRPATTPVGPRRTSGHGGITTRGNRP